MKQPDVEP